MQIEYSNLLMKIKDIGDSIHAFSWKTTDIGVSKQWLTEHDISTERELCELIRFIDESATFFCEEEHVNLIENAESLWIIDPISNTFNFIHWLPHYSICIAHMFKGDIVFAAVYDPSMKELFYAEKWKWTYLNWELVQVSKNTTDLSIIVWPHLVPINLKRSHDTIKLMECFYKFWTIRSIGSLGIHYAYVACGRAECAISLPKDIFPEMAGKLLVEEAWWRFTEFDWTDISLDSKSIIASNTIVHEMFLEELKLLK